MKKDTICPLCNRPPAQVGIIRKKYRMLACNCLPQIDDSYDAFMCVVTGQWQIQSFDISTNKLFFSAYGKAWTLYTTRDGKEKILKWADDNYLNPKDAYQLMLRYEKLLVFL